MTDGFWIRADTGAEIRIHDHEAAIRRPEIALRLGVPVSTFRKFAKYKIGRDRDQFLRWLLRRVPIIRARGYGVYVTLEWGCGTNKAVFKAIHKFGRKVGFGDCTMLCMGNLKTGKRWNIFWLLFDQSMKAGKPIKSVPVTVRGK